MPQLQLRPETSRRRVRSRRRIPGVLGGGMFPNRWVPPSVQRDRPDRRLDGPCRTAVSRRDLAPSTGRSSGTWRTPSDPTMRPMIPLGQFRDTFIIAIDDEGIAIIDQHVAHERVLFERVMERLTRGPLESQRLLVPLLIDAAAGGAAGAGRAARAELERLGFEVEAFGDATIKVTAVPALLEHRRQREGAARAGRGSRRPRPRRARRRTRCSASRRRPRAMPR